MVNRMILFMYKGNYSDEWRRANLEVDREEGHPSSTSLYVNAIMYTLGDKYGIPRFQDRALAKTKNAFTEAFTTRVCTRRFPCLDVYIS